MVGLNREDGHILAIVVLALGCYLWKAAYGLLASASKRARTLSRAFAIFWLANVIFAGLIQIAYG